MNRAEPDLVEHRRGRGMDESPGNVVHPNGTVAAATSRGFLGAAARAVIGLWAQQPRVCVCTPTSRPVLVEPEGSTCYVCSGRVVRRAPFRAES